MRKSKIYIIMLLLIICAANVWAWDDPCPYATMVYCPDGAPSLSMHDNIKQHVSVVGNGGVIYKLTDTQTVMLTEFIGSSNWKEDNNAPCGQESPPYVFGSGILYLRASECYWQGGDYGWRWYWHKFNYVFVDEPTTEECEAVCIYLDTDGDGLSDVIDPYNDDPSGFTWHVYAYQEDESGNYTYFCMKTDRGDRFCYGEEDPNKTTWTSINDPEKQSTELYNYLVGEGLEFGPLGGGSELGVDVPISNDPSEYYFESGVGNDGNTTDLEYLADIVENTQKAADNQSVIGDALSNIEKGINTLNSQMALQGVSEGSSASEIGAAVSSAQESSADTAKTGAESTINANMPGAGDYSGDYTGEDIPDSTQEETDYENSFNAFFSPGTGSFQDFCSQSGFTITSPSAVYTLDAWGNNIDLDFSPCAPAFSTVGVFFLAFAYLRAIWVILRG